MTNAHHRSRCLWGLSALGRQGVAGVLALLRRELETVLRHMGTPKVAAITRDYVQPL